MKACRAVIGLGPMSQLGQKAKYSLRADVFLQQQTFEEPLDARHLVDRKTANDNHLAWPLKRFDVNNFSLAKLGSFCGHSVFHTAVVLRNLAERSRSCLVNKRPIAGASFFALARGCTSTTP
jgi:hypothetical protein